MSRVSELRLVIRVEDVDSLVSLFADDLGLEVLARFGQGDASAVILAAGRATIEVGNAAHGDDIDGLEVGRPVSPQVRLALEVDATDELTRTIGAREGVAVVGPPATMPWGSRNARLEVADGLQLTLFEQLEDEERFV